MNSLCTTKSFTRKKPGGTGGGGSYRRERIVYGIGSELVCCGFELDNSLRNEYGYLSMCG